MTIPQPLPTNKPATELDIAALQEEIASLRSDIKELKKYILAIVETTGAYVL